MNRIEAGRLSASDLEHPDLQPLLLPRDTFDGKGSRLPGAVVKNPGGGKQKHWATCWVVDRKARYVAASGEVRAAADTPHPPCHLSALTTWTRTRVGLRSRLPYCAHNLKIVSESPKSGEWRHVTAKGFDRALQCIPDSH